jgi:Zn-dependent protease
LLFGNLSLPDLLARLIALGIGMTFHEFAHNYVGYVMGDPTPKRLGRLTLNPFVHINWIGWLMFAIIGFGILGSAPISPYNMPLENRRWRWLAAVAAGPVSNLLLAVVFAIPVRLLQNTTVFDNQFVSLLFTEIIYLNIILCLFNFIPLFPLDGWQIVLSLLPPDLAQTWQRHQQTSQYVFFALIIASFVGLPILSILISQPSLALFTALVGGR